MTDTSTVQGDFAPAPSANVPEDSVVANATATSFAPAAVNPSADYAPHAAAPAADDVAHAVAADVADVADAELATDVDAAEPAAPNGFVLLGLAPELVRAVEDLGYTQPTTVQEKTIPLAMALDSEEGKAAGFVDLMVSSQTGSGKTAAFLLPVLHTLIKQQAAAEAAERAEFDAACAEAIANGEAPPKRAKRKDPTSTRNFKAATPGALIVCPTRELAQQVAHDAIGLVQHCRGLRVANVVGGMPYQLQIAKLQNADLVVATPGRLLDLQRSMQIKLDKVQFLVVDEADRMLDLGFSDDLAELNQLTIDRRQTMMFSATFAPRIQQLAQRVMREPQRITIDSPQEKHANIKQMLFWADNSQHKRKLLDHWLRDTTINQAIVFASTQVECDGLANDLQQSGFSAVALHGALSQGLRNRRLMALRQGQVQILVATDVAARGIDVPTITHVFNFGLPMKAEDYTHRIGRTGRAGRDGLAITFAEFRDRRKIFDIEAYSRQRFTAETIPGLEPQQRAPAATRFQGDFGAAAGRGRNEGRDYAAPRDRKFGGPRNDRQAPSGGGFGGGFGGGGGGGFNTKGPRSPSPAPASSYQRNSNSGFGAPNDRADRGDRGSFGDRGFNTGERQSFRAEGAPSHQRFGAGGGMNVGGGFGGEGGNHGARREEPRGARGDFVPRKPGFAKAGPAAAKPFVPHDARKRLTKPVR